MASRANGVLPIIFLNNQSEHGMTCPRTNARTSTHFWPMGVVWVPSPHRYLLLRGDVEACCSSRDVHNRQDSPDTLQTLIFTHSTDLTEIQRVILCVRREKQQRQTVQTFRETDSTDSTDTLTYKHIDRTTRREIEKLQNDGYR